ncbi:apyrase-like [Maniola jurtina]|uniref:apyrase-like n=1 Tax=Maniola jurtina TaxID=191418 RepID=UPI001E68BBE8|nr:apyrase-like [Maniola jurtina]XP_045770765.1 apyrase-like [Maniola jurtina]XP_045770766.1 apyrase-like [Maniola jurtina]
MGSFVVNSFLFNFMVGLVVTFALPFEGLYELNIIHYNDFHARFEETSVETPTCRVNNNSCLGGFPRLYKKIESLRQKKPNSILLNAGDSFQGTYWYTLLKWNITQEFMNLLEHDAHAIGNHEFDDGPEGLAPYLRALKAPILAANMDSSKEPILQGLYRPHIIIERKKRKIGIIGLITPDTKILSSTGDVEFTDPLETVKREAKELNDQGVDIIIVLSHCGLDIDKKIAQDCGEHIDIIVGGHSHSLLWNGPAPSGEEVAGPYPVFIESSANKKHKVVIVQASAYTKYMGNLKVYFNYCGDYIKWEGGPIFLDRNEPEDLEIKARLAPYADLVHRAEQEVIGESQTTLNLEDCVFGECALGDLLVDSMAEYAKTLHPEFHYISFVQRGNIRAPIPSGPITKGTIVELLPFNDRVELFELQGKDVLLALERGVSDAWAMNPFKGPYVLQVSGLQVTYNVSLPEGQRLTSVSVGNSRDSSVPLDSSVYYHVVAPAFLAGGGDGFTMFKDGKRNVEVAASRDQKVLETYIDNHSPINVSKDGRLVVNS